MGVARIDCLRRTGIDQPARFASANGGDFLGTRLPGQYFCAMKILRDWKVILTVVLVFAAGIVTGSALTYLYFRHAFEGGFTVEHWTSKTMKALQKDLNLTPEQEPKVRAIVEETGEYFGQTFGQAIRVAGTNLVDSWDRIDQLLTPEQHIIHQRKCEEFREKLKKGLKVELPPDPRRKEQE